MAMNLLFSFDMKNDIVIQRKIIYAIHIHRKAIELVFILLYYEEGTISKRIVVSMKTKNSIKLITFAYE